MSLRIGAKGGCYRRGMRRIVALVCAGAVVACSSGHTTFTGGLAPNLIPSDGGSPFPLGNGTCPTQGDASACPELGGLPAWVGCTRITADTNTSAFESCTCFATETGEGAWLCQVADAGAPADEGGGPVCNIIGGCMAEPPH